MAGHGEVDHGSGGRQPRARAWRVAGGLLADGPPGGPERILLVANRRRGGAVEWTPPGGVVDPGETMLDALAREVLEETGLVVEGWTGPCCRVRVDFPDRDMTLDVEVHRAVSWQGEMTVDDPDGIVDVGDVTGLVASAPRWVYEPLGAWLADREQGEHAYVARGNRADHLVVERVEDPA